MPFFNKKSPLGRFFVGQLFSLGDFLALAEGCF